MFSTLHDTDDALADLEILAQNQKKLNQLTSRMTGILSGFDSRLAGLEGTMVPIQHRTQTLQRVEKSTYCMVSPVISRDASSDLKPCPSPSPQILTPHSKLSNTPLGISMSSKKRSRILWQGK